jgi:hypothetical protein
MISFIIGAVLSILICGFGIYIYAESMEKRNYSGEIVKKGKSKMPAFMFFTISALVFSVGVALYPSVSVWQKTLSGKAQLREAEWNRQILIQEAEAKREAAKAWAQAEIERAKGAAKANEIVADSLGGSEGYLRWLYIQMLEETNNNVIYIPTEAGLPILEAGKR